MVEQRRERGGAASGFRSLKRFAAGFCSLDGCRPCGRRRQTPPIYSTTLRILPMAIVVPKYRIILNNGRLGFWTRLLCPSARQLQLISLLGALIILCLALPSIWKMQSIIKMLFISVYFVHIVLFENTKILLILFKPSSRSVNLPSWG